MNNVNEEIDKLIEKMKETKEYQNYLYILNQVESNLNINRLVDEIKGMQKQAVKYENENKIEEAKRIDQTITLKFKELNNIPLYRDYINAAEELNVLVNSVETTFQEYVDKLLD